MSDARTVNPGQAVTYHQVSPESDVADQVRRAREALAARAPSERDPRIGRCCYPNEWTGALARVVGIDGDYLLVCDVNRPWLEPVRVRASDARFLGAAPVGQSNAEPTRLEDCPFCRPGAKCDWNGDAWQCRVCQRRMTPSDVADAYRKAQASIKINNHVANKAEAIAALEKLQSEPPGEIHVLEPSAKERLARLAEKAEQFAERAANMCDFDGAARLLEVAVQLLR